MPNITLFSQGDDVAKLHKQLDRLGISVSASEVGNKSFGVATQYALLQAQSKFGLTLSGEYDEASQKAFATIEGFPKDKGTVQGQLFLDNGKVADNLSLNVYRRNSKGQRIALGSAKTDEKGFYNLSFDLPTKDALSLEITAVKTDGKELTLVQPKYNASPQEVINMIAPTQEVTKVDAEYSRLTTDISAAKFGKKLSELKEDKSQQDISQLALSTNWNAKNIALASLAAQRSESTTLSEEVFYGLFRAGFPTGREELAQVSPANVVEALKKVGEVGIIKPLSDTEIKKAKDDFESFAKSVRRDAPLPGGIASFNSVIGKVNLTAVQTDAFESILLDKTTDPLNIWVKCKEKGINDTQVKALRTQGKLGHLTRHSLSLMDELNKIVKDDPNQLYKLIDEGYYDAEKWVKKITETGNIDLTKIDKIEEIDKLNKIVPSSYLGITKDKLEAYADDMARKMRVAYPTDVLLRKLKDGKFTLGAPEPNSRVQVFLEKTVRQFRFGSKPIRKFVKEQEGFIFPPGTTQEQKEATIKDLERLHRAHQLTPTDDAMQILLTENLTSAESVFRFGEEPLIRLFKNNKRNEYEARLTYRKAVQIHTIAFNFITLANEGNSAPGLYATSGENQAAQNRKQEYREKLIREFPTLETLFGSNDFCECEHCRSVLSPAAYFVDLLRFLDIDTTSWNNFKAKWSEEHGGQAFIQKMPFEALSNRRPDLANLPLTCENTNIALPTIDLVNEIMEFFIVHNGKLEANDVYDTGAATTAELIAEPQHLLPAAYDALKEAVYPIGLPFDLWLETVRRFFEQADINFAQSLGTFRDTDILFRPKSVPAGESFKHCYQAEVFAEQLAISNKEYAILTESNINSEWFKFYGYETEILAKADLVSAKKLSQRLCVTYKEIAELLRTGFINPDLDKLAILPNLGITVRDVFQYKGAGGETPLTLSEKTAFDAKLTELSKKYAPFDAKAWLDKAFTDGNFNKALILADPNTGCNFDLTTLRFADGTAADANVFHKLNVFVRLWRKLGWSIEEVDRALQTFYPKQTGISFGEGMRTALIYLAHLKSLDEKLTLGKNSRIKWLTIWSDLPTTGKKPLYAQLFLTANTLKNDQIFDNPLGQYLPDPLASVPVPPEATRPKIADHLPVLQSALGLSSTDIEALIPALPNAYLSLSNVSALYRHATLLKALKISVNDYLILKYLIGLDPFKALEKAPLSDIKDDHPYQQTLKFIEIVEVIKVSAITPSMLNYLFNNVEDSKLSIKQVDIEKLLLTLKNGISQINTEFAIPVLPIEWKDESIAQMFSLLDIDESGNEKNISETESGNLLKLWNGTTEIEILESGAANQIVIPQDDTASLEYLELNSIKIAYDKQRKVQQLIFKGYLTTSVIENLPATMPAMVRTMLDKIRPLQQAFLASLRPNIFAIEADNDLIFSQWKPSVDDLTEKQKEKERTKRESDRRKILAKTLLPLLSEKAKQKFIIENVSMVVSIESNLTTPLLTNTNLLTSNADSTKALWTVFVNQPEIVQTAALIALHKAVIWLTALDLSLEEVSHFAKNKIDFSNFDLNLLLKPVSNANGQNLTSQHLRLTTYTNFRSELQIPGNMLLGIVQKGRQTFPNITTDAEIKINTLQAVCNALAIPLNILNKPASEWVDMAQLMGFQVTVTNNADGTKTGVSDFVNEKALSRLLEGIKIKEKLRVSPKSAYSWSIPNPDGIVAVNLRNTIKGLYDLEAWQQVAKPIFDRLRQKQRDALVNFILHKYRNLGFSTLESLYEYLLIDPGMEPVVQTSRLRQAIFSVQLFIQRCLLNLELDVNPSTINARHWEWMKRYRIWEANRKIFLYPENWLEPEFRDDKTHLYRALEGELLQGDISNDTAERAFFNYLKGLEQIARLEMVSMYLEEVEPTDPSSNTLHVVGRTPNKPHTYFYRQYAHGMWTPWEPIDAEIESDHIVAVKWKDRLHIFWVMFMQKPKPQSFDGGATLFEASKVTGANINAISTPVHLQAQLNWVEYFQGEWKGRQSTPFHDLEAQVSNLSSLFIHASKEYATDGYEAAVNIHLSGLTGPNNTFKVISKLTPPVLNRNNRGEQSSPLNAQTNAASKKTGSGSLIVKFVQETNSSTVNGETKNTERSVDIPILKKALSGYNILTPSTPFSFGDNTVNDNRDVIGTLIKPFFYEDEQHTFFVEPAFDEVTIERWEEWTIPEFVPGTIEWDPRKLEISPVFPKYKDYIQPVMPKTPNTPFGGIDPIDPRVKFNFKEPTDWVMRPQTLVEFGNVLIHDRGGFSPDVFRFQASFPTLNDKISDIGSLNTGLNDGNINLGNVISGIGKDWVLPIGTTQSSLSDVSKILSSNDGFSVATKKGFDSIGFNAGNINTGNLGGLLNKNFTNRGF